MTTGVPKIFTNTERLVDRVRKLKEPFYIGFGKITDVSEPIISYNDWKWNFLNMEIKSDNCGTPVKVTVLDKEYYETPGDFDAVKFLNKFNIKGLHL